MRKILLSLVLVGLITSLIGGCGGSSSKSGGGKTIKAFISSGAGGGVALSDDSRGVVYAGNFEIKDQYALHMPTAYKSSPCVEACLYDGGTRLKDSVNVTKDFANGNDCFEIAHLYQLGEIGGTGFNLEAKAIGKAKLVLNCQDVTKEINIYTYDSADGLAENEGLKITATGKTVSTNLDECAVYWRNNGWKTKGKTYVADTYSDSGFGWGDGIINVKQVDLERLGSGNTDVAIEGGKVYVVEVPGGYIKVSILAPNLTWEFSSNGVFK